MSIHDSIGDFITVIRNAGSAGKASCSYPHSNLRQGIAKILKDRGFVEELTEGVNDKGIKKIDIQLKYVNGEHAIRGISRLSTPGRRSYCGYREIPQTLGGLGISILSTPKGIMDDKSARSNKLGGELLCSVW
jgi:small subunit ribosomal protein S8